MGWPNNSPGTPFGVRQGVEEGFETFLTGIGGGIGGDAYAHHNPAPVITGPVPQNPPGPTSIPGASDYVADAAYWIAQAQPTSPFNGWDPAPTPVPATQTVPAPEDSKGAPSEPRRPSKAKKATKKEPSTEGSSGYLAAFHRGRKVSWP